MSFAIGLLIIGVYALLAQELRIMSTAIDDLKAEVEKVKTVQASAVTLITGLVDQLKSVVAAVPPSLDTVNISEITSIITDLEAATAPLAAAVIANTAIAPPVEMPVT